MSRSIHFNFHGIVGVTVNTDHPDDSSFFAAEYQHHRTELLPPELPVVTLNYRRKKAGIQLDAQRFTWHRHKYLANWGYRTEINTNHIHLDVVGNRMAVSLVHHMLLHPSLRYLSAIRGVLLLHAGAVAFDGKSVILTGQGGTGKTTTTSILMAAGGPRWRPHADDYVFIAPGPQTKAYMTRSHLYRDLLRWVPELSQRLTLSERLRLEIFGRIRSWSQENIKWPVRLPIERLWTDREMQPVASPAALVYLQRSPAVSAPELHRLTGKQIPLDDLLEMNFFEARHFIKLLRKANDIPDLDSWLHTWRKREYRLLQERLEEIPAYTLTLPQHVTTHTAKNDLLVNQLTPLLSTEDPAHETTIP